MFKLPVPFDIPGKLNVLVQCHVAAQLATMLQQRAWKFIWENYGKMSKGQVFCFFAFFFFWLADIKIKEVMHASTVVHIQGAIFIAVRAGRSFLSLKESLSSD